jgi:F0F1-type ATP synthase delta subunit
MILTNDSTHSTFAVDAAIKQPTFSAPAKSSAIRRVCFDEDSNEYLDNTTRVAEECHETWYAKEDYKQFRAQVREKVQESLNEQENGNSAIYTSIRNLYMSACNVDYMLEDASQLLNHQQQKQLAEIYSSEHAADLVGMEYHVFLTLRRTFVRREN